ncbi:MAG: RNA-directed DNA polymerase [Anaerolineae bacterium]|nr:RNA-directed DNA polymerase [Anaerolineae bacterium]NUQ07215.1 RNA-dependent DNA polymerase [Anaerolineae bacterium]
MKTYNHLYAQIANFQSLYAAWRKARRGKRYTPSASAFESSLDEALLQLYEALSDESYRPGAYRSFTINEPKRRRISAAPFRDRVVHHALCAALTPIYERKFIYDSYANRVGKGTHAALDRCTQFMRKWRYVLQCDIEQFFPAVDHALLKEMLARTIACRKTLRLCDKIIDGGAGILDSEYTIRWFPQDKSLFDALRPRGLPIGNQTSQFWANVYLNPLDHFIKRELGCRGYLRYVDDFLLFADDTRTLHLWREAIMTFLDQQRLTIHENRAQPTPVEHGIPFLGFTVFPTHRRLKREKGIAFRRHLYGLYHAYRRGEIPHKKLKASIQAWVGHAAHGDTWGLRREIFAGMVG